MTDLNFLHDVHDFNILICLLLTMELSLIMEDFIIIWSLLIELLSVFLGMMRLGGFGILKTVGMAFCLNFFILGIFSNCDSSKCFCVKWLIVK